MCLFVVIFIFLESKHHIIVNQCRTKEPIDSLVVPMPNVVLHMVQNYVFAQFVNVATMAVNNVASGGLTVMRMSRYVIMATRHVNNIP